MGHLQVELPPLPGSSRKSGTQRITAWRITMAHHHLICIWKVTWKWTDHHSPGPNMARHGKTRKQHPNSMEFPVNFPARSISPKNHRQSSRQSTFARGEWVGFRLWVLLFHRDGLINGQLYNTVIQLRCFFSWFWI